MYTTDLVLYFYVVGTLKIDRFKKNGPDLSCVDRNSLTLKLDLYLTLNVNGMV